MYFSCNRGRKNIVIHRRMIFSVTDTVGIITAYSNADTNVLQEKYTIKFIQNCIRDPRSIFFIS